MPLLLIPAPAAASLQVHPTGARVQELAFPLIPAASGDDRGQLELVLVEEELELLTARERALFRDVPLPGGLTLDLDLRRVDLARLDVGVFLDARPAPGALAPLDLSVWQGELPGVRDAEVSLGFSRFGCHGWVRVEERLFHLVSEASVDHGWARARSRWVTDERLRQERGPAQVRCANDELEELSGQARAGDPRAALGSSPATGTSALGAELHVASIAVESDHQYYQVFGDTNAALAYVTTRFAWVSNRYETQVGTLLTLPYINFYTTPADPWTTPESGGNCIDMIYEFQGAWQGNVPLGADIAHFLSGADLGCGVAFLEGLCDPLENFSVSGNGNGQVPFPIAPSDANLDFYLVCHELGHNFGAIHTHDYCPPIDECAPAGYFGPCQTQQACTYPGTLMSYCHGCGGFSNINTWFHPQSALDMRAWVATAACLPRQCLDPVTYCTSQLNSDGCSAKIGYSGSPSLSGADDFHVTALDVVPQKSGLLFYGLAPDSTPLLGGTLCVQAPIVRTPATQSGGVLGIPCDGSFDFFWSQAFSAAEGLAAGTTIYAQYWYRDPAAPTGAGLSDGLQFSLCR